MTRIPITATPSPIATAHATNPIVSIKLPTATKFSGLSNLASTTGLSLVGWIFNWRTVYGLK
jgi:hypothetical protein